MENPNRNSDRDSGSSDFFLPSSGLRSPSPGKCRENESQSKATGGLGMMANAHSVLAQGSSATCAPGAFFFTDSIPSRQACLLEKLSPDSAIFLPLEATNRQRYFPDLSL